MLRIITDIIQYNRNLQPVIGRIARHDRNLADQIRRSAQSVALNTMESTARVGGDARQRLRTALGEIRETRMALQLAIALGYVPFDTELDDVADKITATLWKLARVRTG